MYYLNFLTFYVIWNSYKIETYTIAVPSVMANCVAIKRRFGDPNIFPRFHRIHSLLHMYIAPVGQQRSYQRWLDKKIYKPEMKFWAVLSSQGCKEKQQLLTIISMQLFGVVFSTFCGPKKFRIS